MARNRLARVSGALPGTPVMAPMAMGGCMARHPPPEAHACSHFRGLKFSGWVCGRRMTAPGTAPGTQEVQPGPEPCQPTHKGLRGCTLLQ